MNKKKKIRKKENKNADINNNNIIQEVPVSSSSIFDKFFCCCKKKTVDVNENEEFIKLLKPLIQLKIDTNSDIHLQIFKKMLQEFAKAYLIVEELLLKELSTFIMNRDKNKKNENDISNQSEANAINTLFNNDDDDAKEVKNNDKEAKEMKKKSFID